MSRITANTSSTTKDESERFGGNDVEIAPKSFGFCETINPDPQCVIKEMGFFFLIK